MGSKYVSAVTQIGIYPTALLGGVAIEFCGADGPIIRGNGHSHHSDIEWIS